jgi:hypothetical protein
MMDELDDEDTMMLGFFMCGGGRGCKDLVRRRQFCLGS